MNQIPSSMMILIQRRLAEFEAEQDIQVIFACESGSRAWGFPSRDSDYDVRFLYVRPLPWYLAVSPRPDTLEVELPGDLDLAGWDIRKAFHLLGKGNAPLLEWLVSPIIYQRESAIEPLERLVAEAFRPDSTCHHYLAQARRSVDKMAEDNSVRYKAYCYAIRSAFSALFVADQGHRPPMELSSLMAACEVAPEVKDAIEDLVERKKGATEADRTPRVALIDGFLRDTLADVGQRAPGKSMRASSKSLDAGFQETLRLAS